MKDEKYALYLCCIADPWIPVAKRLYSELGLKPVYFVHWGSDSSSFEGQFDESCHLQNMEDAWKGRGFPEALKPAALDESDFKKIAWYELNALKMMDRLDPLGNYFSFQQRRYFFQDLLGYWLAYIDAVRLDVVVSPSIPHRVFDYALYVACKIRNIRFVIFQGVPFGSNSLLIDDIDSIGEKYRLDYEKIEYCKPSQFILERIDAAKNDYSKAMPKYMARQEENNKFSFFGILKNIRKLITTLLLSVAGYPTPNTYWVERGKVPSDSNYSWFRFYKVKAKSALRVRRLERGYNNIVSKTLPSRYVLVALHYQPEETSCPTGGSYADQISLVRLLDQALPSDVSILVKEHKSQFYNDRESSSGRDNSYYDRLSSISGRVYFASANESPFVLLDQAIATVTISGTIGWESAIRGTPTLIFGRAWYEYMPRVYKVKTKSDIASCWDSVIDSKDKNLDAQIIHYHGLLEKRFCNAKHYKSKLNMADVTMTESTENLFRSLKDLFSVDS